MGYIFSAILIWLIFYAIAKIKHISWFGAVKFSFLFLLGSFVNWILSWIKALFFAFFGDSSDD